jgi:cobaltochelatase CobS
MLTKKATCQICGFEGHVLELHLAKEHGLTADAYLEQFPDAALMSPAALKKMAELEAMDQAKVDADIKALFGVYFNDKVKTIPAFATPQVSTPPVDADYVFEKMDVALMCYAMLNPAEKVLLTGPTGSGKSSIVEQTAARLNWPFYRVNMDGDITRADFVGQWKLVDGNMSFLYGILPRAMRDGAILLVDEWDAANPSVGMVLQAVLEGKPLMLAETGELIYPHPNFRIFATANTVGQGDTTGLYNGTQPQNFATLDRFTMVQVVNYPAKAKERAIVMKKAGLDGDLAAKLVDVANLVREAFKKGETMATMSTRTIVNVGQKMKDFGDVRMAYNLGFLNKLQAEDRELCGELVQRIWGA